jgi:hypothetical protein
MEIEMCWFGEIHRVEGNEIVLVWGGTESGRKWNCVGLGKYSEWMEIEMCWFGEVQRVDGNRILLVWGGTESEWI